MENKRNERDNYVRHGLIVACIVCILGVCFDMSKVALSGAILLCAVQLVDLIWYIIEIKCKDCKNVKQVFCRCKDVEIVNEWENLATKFGRCVKCGRYFMINENIDSCVKISEEEYKHSVEMFNAIELAKKNIENRMAKFDLDNIQNLFDIKKEDNKEKENKE